MNIVRQRRSIRLPSYDYSHAGSYFVTVCTHERECRFGEIANGHMQLNTLGGIVREQWQQLPARFPHVALDAFVVMPNHVHGIIQIVGAPLAGAQLNPDAQLNADAQSNDGGFGNLHVSGRSQGSPLHTLGNIIGAYKSLCLHHYLQWVRLHDSSVCIGKIWQRNYWEHVIRNENSLNAIRQYIHNNPHCWEKDRLHRGKP